MNEKFIIELRTRLIRFLLVFFVLFAGSCYFSSGILSQLINWCKDTIGLDIISTALVAPIYLKIKLAAYIATFLCFLHFLFEIWCFFIPALYDKEKKFARAIIWVLITAFYLGALLSFIFVFKYSVMFFISSGVTDLRILLDISNLLDLCFYITIICQLLILLPLILGILMLYEIVPLKVVKTLRTKVIIACFILGMFLTPPDVISQICVALPLWISFELVVFIAENSRFLTRSSKINISKTNQN